MPYALARFLDPRRRNPAELYRVIAEILAFVYHLEGRTPE